MTTINFIPANFTLDTGFYYSLPFKQDSKDSAIAIEVVLSATGKASLQISTNKTDWADVTDSEFDCEPFGLQPYVNGHPDLFYRIKTNQLVVSAKVLI